MSFNTRSRRVPDCRRNELYRLIYTKRCVALALSLLSCPLRWSTANDKNSRPIPPAPGPPRQGKKGQGPHRVKGSKLSCQTGNSGAAQKPRVGRKNWAQAAGSSAWGKPSGLTRRWKTTNLPQNFRSLREVCADNFSGVGGGLQRWPANWKNTRMSGSIRPTTNRRLHHCLVF